MPRALETRRVLVPAAGKRPRHGRTPVRRAEEERTGASPSGGDGIGRQTHTLQTGPRFSSVPGVLKLEKQLPRAAQTLLCLHSSTFSLPQRTADAGLLPLLYLPVYLPGRV